MMIRAVLPVIPPVGPSGLWGIPTRGRQQHNRPVARRRFYRSPIAPYPRLTFDGDTGEVASLSFLDALDKAAQPAHAHPHERERGENRAVSDLCHSLTQVRYSFTLTDASWLSPKFEKCLKTLVFGDAWKSRLSPRAGLFIGLSSCFYCVVFLAVSDLCQKGFRSTAGPASRAHRCR